MTLAVIAAIAYGLLSIIGGIVGYTKVHSKPSLISGLISGILLVVGGLLIARGAIAGLVLSTLVTVVLIVVFAIRLSKTKKIMPAGVMLIVGIVALIGLLPALLAATP